MPDATQPDLRSRQCEPSGEISVAWWWRILYSGGRSCWEADQHPGPCPRPHRRERGPKFFRSLRNNLALLDRLDEGVGPGAPAVRQLDVGWREPPVLALRPALKCARGAVPALSERSL